MRENNLKKNNLTEHEQFIDASSQAAQLIKSVRFKIPSRSVGTVFSIQSMYDTKH